MQSDARKKAPYADYTRSVQFTCKTVNFTCIYAASTSRRIHAAARNGAHKLRVTSLARCRLIYIQLAGEFTRGVIAATASVFTCRFGFFSLQLRVFLRL